MTRKEVYEAVICGLLLVIVFLWVSQYLDLKLELKVAGVVSAFMIGAGIIGTVAQVVRMIRKGGYQFLFDESNAEAARKLLVSIRGEEVAFAWDDVGERGFQVFPGEADAFEELLRRDLKLSEARPGNSSLLQRSYRKNKL